MTTSNFASSIKQEDMQSGHPNLNGGERRLPLPLPINWANNFTSSIEQEDMQSGHPNLNGGERRLPPPINWATRPIPRSLPTTPRKLHQTISNPNLNLEKNCNNSGDSFPQMESARGCEQEFPLAHPKYHFVTAPTSSPRTREKYYVVFVGKCVGIFTFWPYVKSLTKDSKDATFQGFETFELAAENYNKARSIGVVSIRRVPGDDLHFGAASEGIQDAIIL